MAFILLKIVQGIKFALYFFIGIDYVRFTATILIIIIFIYKLVLVHNFKMFDYGWLSGQSDKCAQARLLGL